MRLYIGTYRADREMIERCMASLVHYVKGYDDVHFIDDSGDENFRLWLMRYGYVHPVALSQKGYARAMSTACNAMLEASDYAAAWWEEDFTACAPIDLEHLARNLTHKLCQVVLMRQPWFDDEKEHGVLGALEARTGQKVTWGPGETGEVLHWHQAQFSTNPGVWSSQVWRHGWPEVHGSEDLKTKQLVEHDDQWFAWLPGQTVEHSGERQGIGY